MSGGHFKYLQYRLEDIASEIEKLVKTNSSEGINEFGHKIGRNFSEITILKFKKTVQLLRATEKAVDAIDWLVSSDDDESDFDEKWKKIVEENRGLL